MEEKVKTCHCDETCDCGCNEGQTCKCESNCECENCCCTEENNCGCMSGESCTCDDECCCGHDCECEEEHCCCNDECDCDDKHKKEKKDKKEKYKKEIKALEEKVKELETKALASQAEMINYRRRKDEEVTRMLKYANEDMVTELLQTIDNFERAIKMDDSNLEDEVSKFLQGFKMIYCNLVNTLEKFEVKAIDGSNKEFDPTYHQAVMTEKVDGVESGMVVEVLQKGYLLKDKVIRPAMVKVSE